MVKPRKPFVALLLSVLPGLGQIYNGQVKKGLLFILIDLLVPILLGLFGILHHISGLVLMLCYGIAFVIYRMADGYIVAKRLKHYELQPFNKWYVYLLIAVSLFVIRVFLDGPTSMGYQTFQLATPSMAPTLHRNDRVMTDLYGRKDQKVDYGDIVMFNSPQDDVWAFRVIALPLDTIEIVDGLVYVNGEVNAIEEKNRYLFNEREEIEYEEKLSNNKKIKTLRSAHNNFPAARNMPALMVPEDEFFLMGDNRDNVMDSRFIGTIGRDELVGKVLYIYWGDSYDRINIDLRPE